MINSLIDWLICSAILKLPETAKFHQRILSWSRHFMACVLKTCGIYFISHEPALVLVETDSHLIVTTHRPWLTLHGVVWVITVGPFTLSSCEVPIAKREEKDTFRNRGLRRTTSTREKIENFPTHLHKMVCGSRQAIFHDPPVRSFPFQATNNRAKEKYSSFFPGENILKIRRILNQTRLRKKYSKFSKGELFSSHICLRRNKWQHAYVWLLPLGIWLVLNVSPSDGSTTLVETSEDNQFMSVRITSAQQLTILYCSVWNFGRLQSSGFNQTALEPGTFNSPYLFLKTDAL